jgi:predicted amino acid-binding ACT domain protein
MPTICGRAPVERRSGRDRRRGSRVDERAAPADLAERAMPREGGVDAGRPLPVLDPEGLVRESSGALAAQLAQANAEIARLRQRLLELNCSNIMVVQLANAKVEIDALRERLFECYSYRTAYRCLLSARQLPRAGNA